MGLSNDHLELDWTEWPVHRNRVKGKWTFQPPFWIKLNDQFTETWWRANGTFQPPFWTKLNNQFTDRVEGKWDFTTTILNGTELNHQFTESGWRANGTFQKPSWTGLNWTTSSPRQGGRQMGLSNYHVELNWTTSLQRQGGGQMGLSNHHVELAWTAWPVHRDSEQNFIMREESLPLCFSLFVTSGGFGAGSLPSLPVLSCICNTVSEHISLAVSHIRGRGISHASLLLPLSWKINTETWHHSILKIKSTLH